MKIHKYSTIQEISEFVTTENADDFIKHFGELIKVVVDTKKKIPEFSKMTGLPKECFSLIPQGVFTWIEYENR